ncbi:metalloregulator ArsR/SmtB family transcription factor [Mycobacterium sp. ACS4331]|uniref:ArsR/SmtB family transcription factor n=1 Tax=Mycobacterium sp. ACS4331 TaxID=1834121 RepID=UPI0007FF9C8D|nr:metalloregulator ArsR/SmtB family transcription factor [Mycobacterium sp. ACS4331]OBF21195.1 transcriptional regulator [Mycobacterium sp. ACS4331]
MPARFLDDGEQPLYEIKANLFKALAHPARIRILEILCSAPESTPVRDILATTGLEATLLSQHLAVLKRHQVVTAERVGNAVFYRLAHPQVSELLRIARIFLTDTLAARQDQLNAIRSLPAIGPTP